MQEVQKCLLQQEFCACCDLIEDNHFDLAITDMWLSIDDSSTGITPVGYQLLLDPRVHGTGGGVTVIYKSTFMTRQLDTPNADIQIQWLSFYSSYHIYRSPPNTKNGYTTSEFLAGFAHLMAMDTTNLLIAGDFNLHMDDESNNDTRRFLDQMHQTDVIC